ncbi:hypothetical protein M885DRAFT_317916 [Pelagophyceae sp. CCMP2097]|nr:hypothetical protein M885DRAFT_317916 [Pelagophyceae sp. CCMP2097]
MAARLDGAPPARPPRAAATAAPAARHRAVFRHPAFVEQCAVSALGRLVVAGLLSPSDDAAWRHKHAQRWDGVLDGPYAARGGGATGYDALAWAERDVLRSAAAVEALLSGGALAPPDRARLCGALVRNTRCEHVRRAVARWICSRSGGLKRGEAGDDALRAFMQSFEGVVRRAASLEEALRAVLSEVPFLPLEAGDGMAAVLTGLARLYVETRPTPREGAPRSAPRSPRGGAHAAPPRTAAAHVHAVAYVQLFALLMLNADLHSSAIRASHRITEDAYVRAARSTPLGELGDAHLRAMHAAILSAPLPATLSPRQLAAAPAETLGPLRARLLVARPGAPLSLRALALLAALLLGIFATKRALGGSLDREL